MRYPVLDSGRSRAAPVRTPSLARSSRAMALSRHFYEPIEPQLCSAWRTVVQYRVQLWNQRYILRRAVTCNPAVSARNLLLVFKNDVVDDAVFFALLRVHDEVALHVALDLLQPLTGMLGDKLAGDLAHAQNLARVDVDIGRLSRKPDING